MRNKIRFLKRLLQASLLVNGFFIAAGVVALYKYLQVYDVVALHVAIVGVGVLIFGLVIPWFIFKQLTEIKNALRKQTEETVTRLISGWVQSYEEAEGQVFEDPLFWVNVLLIAVEVFGENSKHPAAMTLMEFIPLIRSEIKKARSGKKKKVKS